VGSRLKNIVSKGGLFLLLAILIIIPVVSASGDGESYTGGFSSATAAAVGGGVAAGVTDALFGEEKMEEEENIDFNPMPPEVHHQMDTGAYNRRNNNRVFGCTKPHQQNELNAGMNSPESIPSPDKKRATLGTPSNIVKGVVRLFGSRDGSRGSSRNSAESRDSRGSNADHSNNNNDAQKKEGDYIFNHECNVSDNNIADTSDDVNDPDKELDELLHECELENSIDGETADVDDNAKVEGSTTMNIDSISDVGGTLPQLFATLLNKARDMHKGEKVSKEWDKISRMRKVMMELILFVNHVQHSEEYKNMSAKQVEAKCNAKRKEVGEAIATYLRDEGYGHLANIINLGTPFCTDTLIIFYLHYAPEGTNSVDGDKFNFCHPRQCCIHTMFSKLLNFLINEDEYGSECMLDWSFGGKTDVDKTDKMVAVDLIPFLLKKKKTDGEMSKQYQAFSDRLGLASKEELMMIPYCLIQLHLLLHQKSRNGKKCQLHIASSATAKYAFGREGGVKKYLTKFVSDLYVITFGPHPQVFLM
jgi:hypothetical protein